MCMLLAMASLSFADAAELMVEISTHSTEPIRMCVSDDLSITVDRSTVIIADAETEHTLILDDVKGFRYLTAEHDVLSEPASTASRTLHWDGTKLTVEGARPDDICTIVDVSGKTVIQSRVEEIDDFDFSELAEGMYIVVIRNFPAIKIVI